MVNLPTIPEFFTNKTIFITGGSGFIGKVLIEKLLRSCPGLKTIYLLMRSKKGQTPEERISSILELPLFDVLKSQNPDVDKKLKIVTGDVAELKLGLSEKEEKRLIEEVDVIFHVAASVRFDQPLKDAILMNTRGTREVMRLASQMKSLAVLLHVSTTYAHTDRKVIEEHLYPAHMAWEKVIEIAETTNKDILNVLTKKFIAPLHNTYVFTKSLAEHVVHDLGNGKIPVVVLRPSIVVSSFNEPFAGWIDNFNGPSGLSVGCLKGVIRTFHANPHIASDYMAVDIVVKEIIVTAWIKATTEDASKRLEIDFYNASNNDLLSASMQDLLKLNQTLCYKQPFNNIFWYPNTTVDKCYYSYMLKFIFYQLLPALLVDGLFKLTGRKPILLKIQKRIYTTNMALLFFLQNSWKFENSNTSKSEYALLRSDVKDFEYINNILDVDEYAINAAIGLRKYLLKESDDTFEQAKKHSGRMRILSLIFNFLWYLGLFWLLLIKIDVISIILH